MTPSLNGRDVLLAHAPRAGATLETIGALPLPDLADPRTLAFAEQFGVDVARIDDALRAAFLAATGGAALDVVTQIYAHDVAPRAVAALDAFFGDSVWPTGPTISAAPWPIVDDFLAAVAQLSAVDPVVTEMVRLRGARQHDCRLCRSRRSADALSAGASEVEFDAIDTWPSSNLPVRVKAALGLVDAMIWEPFSIAPTVLDAVRGHFSDAEVVELILDVARNASNKIAVALGADAAAVTEGVELFTVNDMGAVVVI